MLTPLYVFWSRAFMIETTVLFFSLMYAVILVDLVIYKVKPSNWDLLALFVVGVLASLIKVTTFIPLFIVGSVIILFQFYLAYRNSADTAKYLIIGFINIAIFAVTPLVWIKHTDLVKSLNPIGVMLTSENLRLWNFGTLDQRIDPYIWLTLANRTAEIYFPFPMQLAWIKVLSLIILVATFTYCLVHCSWDRRRQVVFLLFLFLFPFLIFTNLHQVHNYYQAANALFLSLALGIAFIGALENSKANHRTLIFTLYLLILGLFIGSSVWHFKFKSSYEQRYLHVGAYIDCFQKKSVIENFFIISASPDFQSENCKVFINIRTSTSSVHPESLSKGIYR